MQLWPPDRNSFFHCNCKISCNAFYLPISGQPLTNQVWAEGQDQTGCSQSPCVGEEFPQKNERLDQ